MAGPVFAPKDVSSKVELSISCQNLKDLDYFSKSDPSLFLYEKRGQIWEKIGRTEVIDNNLNPKVCDDMLSKLKVNASCNIQSYSPCI